VYVHVYGLNIGALRGPGHRALYAVHIRYVHVTAGRWCYAACNGALGLQASVITCKWVQWHYVMYEHARPPRPGRPAQLAAIDIDTMS